jgi:hypothetical protein
MLLPAKSCRSFTSPSYSHSADINIAVADIEQARYRNLINVLRFGIFSSALWVQQETHAPQQIAKLFDHLGSADEQRGGDGEAERFGSLHVDDQLEFSRLLHRHVGRLGAFQNFIDVVACTAE